MLMTAGLCSRLFLVLFFIMLFAVTDTIGQREFLENNCDYNFNLINRSKDINVKYFVPCSWIEEDSDLPDLLKKYSYHVENGDLLIYSIGVKENKDLVSEKETYEIFSRENLIVMSANWGDPVSARRMKISGKNSGEVILDSHSNNPKRHIRSMLNFFIYKKYLITLSFVSVSLSKESAIQTFNRYQPVFNYLILKTEIVL